MKSSSELIILRNCFKLVPQACKTVAWSRFYPLHWWTLTEVKLFLLEYPCYHPHNKVIKTICQARGRVTSNRRHCWFKRPSGKLSSTSFTINRQICQKCWNVCLTNGVFTCSQGPSNEYLACKYICGESTQHCTHMGLQRYSKSNRLCVRPQTELFISTNRFHSFVWPKSWVN